MDRRKHRRDAPVAAHDQNAGDKLAEIRALASGYELPDDVCTTYRLLYRELQAFERDLHRHVHLENNVLFPRAIQIEAQK